jgi:hypothetical protein
MRYKLLFILCLCFPKYLLASPQIGAIVPQGLVPGTNTVLKFSGSGLDKVTELWTSFGGRARRITNSNPNEVTFDVECPASGSGVGAVQLVGPNGISDFQLILADSLRSERSSTSNQSIAQAQFISPPVAIDGALKTESIDYYKFKGKAREIVSIEVYAHRLGSQMDPVVKVLNQDGKELAFADDEGGTSRDSRFQFSCPLDAEYILAVHDIGYGGGKNYDYRLRVGEFPLEWYRYPLQPVEDNRPELFGLGKMDLADSEVSSFDIENKEEGILEREPNNNPAQGESIRIPSCVNGKFQYSGDVDYFKFSVEKNQKLIFHGATRSLGSPADLLLRITKEDGTVLKEGDVSEANEGSLTNLFEVAGDYWLQVRELSGVAGPNLPYAIHVEEGVPGFTLSCEEDKIEIAPAGSATVKVSATRYDYDGPISMEILDPLSGISLESQTIPAGKNEIGLKITASEQSTPGTYGHFKLIGRAETKQGNFTNEVSTAAALKKTFPLFLYAPRSLNGLFSFAIKEK